MKRTDLTILFCVSAAVLLWNLASGSLSSWDEAIYAGVSREILETRDWIALRWAGLPWSEKPPLCMWMTAFFYMLLGISEFSARLFSALCGIGTVLATYLLAHRLYSRKAAFASAMVLLSSWHFIWSSKTGMLDMPLTFFVTLSILLFRMGEDRKLCLFFSPLAFSCAFLAKGWPALIVPVILFTYVACRKNLRILKEPFLVSGAVVAVLILVWWHAMVFSCYGNAFIKSYFTQHFFMRAVTTLDGHTGDFFTYLGVIPNKGRPWAGVGLALTLFLIWRIFKCKEKEHILPVVWAGSVLILFSMVKTKLHWYVMPVYPALSIMTGWAAGKLFKKYTVPIISVLSILSLVYLTVDKGIFDLDYTPRAKQLAIDVKRTVPQGQELFLYGVNDPGMQFYLGSIGKNIREEEELRVVLGEKDTFILVGEKELETFPEGNYTVAFREANFALIRTQ